MVAFTGWRGERQRSPGFYITSYMTRGLRSGSAQRPPDRVHQHSDPTHLRKSGIMCNTPPKIKRWYGFSGPRDTDVKSERKNDKKYTSCYAHSWIFEWRTLQPHKVKINSQRLQYSPSSLISFFFRPFQHSEPCAPCPTSTAENPSYQTTNKSYRLLPRDPECDQAYYFLIVMISMTGPCIILLTLQYIDYGQIQKGHTYISFLIWLGWKVGTDTSGIFSLI